MMGGSMPDRPLRTRRRLPASLTLSENFQQVILTEDRRREWRNLALVTFLCSLFVGGLLASVAGQPNMLPALAMVVCPLFGIPLLIAGLFVYPWNRQVEIDSRHEFCLLRTRFYNLPCWTVGLPLAHGELRVEQIRRPRMTREASEGGSGGLAVLSLLLGPLGLLISGFNILSSIKRTEIRAWALVYRDNRFDDARPRILLACTSNQSLLRAEQAYSGWIH